MGAESFSSEEEIAEELRPQAFDSKRVSHLPPPGGDITKTSHLRTFAVGSGGPQMDVLLYNQITILRMLNEIRNDVSQLLKNKPIGKKAMDTVLYSAKSIDVDDIMYKPLSEALKKYKDEGGVLLQTRSHRFTQVYQELVAHVRLNKDFMELYDDTINDMPKERLEAFHLRIAQEFAREEKDPKGKSKSTSHSELVEISSEDDKAVGKRKVDDSDDDILPHRARRGVRKSTDKRRRK